METTYYFKESEGKLVEKLVDDYSAMINHMILNKNDSVPEHKSDSNIYLLVVGGTLTLALNDLNAKNHAKGSIINVPYDTKMNVSNAHGEQLELFVIKAPNPKAFSIKGV